MSMNPNELVSFANTFSNRTGGPSVKKKSAAARQRAKAKGLKNAAYVALGSPAGKKTKNSGGKSTAGSKSTGGKSTRSSSSSSKSKTVTNTGSVYATSAASKAKSIADSKAAGMNNAAAVALGNPRTKQLNMDKMKKLHYSVAAIALGSQATASPKKTTKATTGNGPSKPRANIW